MKTVFPDPPCKQIGPTGDGRFNQIESHVHFIVNVLKAVPCIVAFRLCYEFV